MGWDKVNYIPSWDSWKWGLLDWNKTINPLACGIKCADKVNTVSPGYMKELMYEANGLESLFNYEMGKCSGILNGIDYAVWDPGKDTYILDNYGVKDFKSGKKLNKKSLCNEFNFDESLPLIIFIGRLVHEKAADLLPGSISRAFWEAGHKFSCLILGSGDPGIEASLQGLQNNWVGYYNTQIKYNEKLSHQMYAGADFILMPSRVEPCGLNQLYSMRYGTVPVVRRTGGLKDTVIDFGDDGGYGICFNNASEDDIVYSIHRSISLYDDKKKMDEIRKRMMQINSSWETSAAKYIELYKSITF
jgi:starch synthase